MDISSMLSIPAWFDWRGDTPYVSRRRHMLSIPAWFDWRPPEDATILNVVLLSIPAWFDWRLSLDDDVLRGYVPFNPSLVRLARNCHGGEWPKLPLSIPAWFDWRSFCSISWAWGGTLSIPAWFDWRLRSVAGKRQQPQPFNPSLVRLAHHLRHQVGLQRRVFQSQLGSIGARQKQ